MPSNSEDAETGAHIQMVAPTAAPVRTAVTSEPPTPVSASLVDVPERVVPDAVPAPVTADPDAPPPVLITPAQRAQEQARQAQQRAAAKMSDESVSTPTPRPVAAEQTTPGTGEVR